MINEPPYRPNVGLHNTELARARGAALRLLAARSRSVVEMQERLGRRFARDTVEETVTRLIADGLLNDEEFAQQWRQSRERPKPRSRRMIEQELKQRGVTPDVIDHALEDYDSLGAAYRSVVKYASRQDHSDRVVFERRVTAFLGRRGFEPGIARQTLRRIWDELEVVGSVTPEPEYD